MLGPWPFNKRAFGTYALAGPGLTYFIFGFLKLPEYAGGVGLGLIVLAFVSIAYFPIFALGGIAAGTLAGFLHKSDEPGWLTAMIGVAIGCGTMVAITHVSSLTITTVKLPYYLPLIGAFAGALCALIQYREG